MHTPRPALQERRAMALATLTLTRRPDLLVQQQQHDFGVDLLVSLAPEGRWTGRMFGVQLKAFLERPGPIRFSEPEVELFAQSVVPMVLFVFTMVDDEGRYAWLNGPDASDEIARTGGIPVSALLPLTDEAVQQIVERVRLWPSPPSTDPGAARTSGLP